ncbi:hypothetical protein GXW74_25805 [Roseomonas eburnea]|uniref:Uncharacterized protein n=2 Tax=Neoroseomonas eburnea TaxID=1346889 RepID=A0A9X9XJM8_9PROT|nr:hypothetical protein [Neoroseomonas eburnea]MBR0683914.1 hypothetical protein [Neoroseomonas eburnea]
MLWDKPWIYGPFLHTFHWRVTLWGPLVAQALIVSHLLWLTQRVLRGAAPPIAHVAVCAVAAALTIAPFTVALLMPDVFAPVVVLSLSLLSFARSRLSRAEAAYLGVLASLAVASHLAHLPLALAMVALALAADLLRRGHGLPWGAPRAAAPVVAAVALLLATNWVGHGRAALSPHGATFMLARLQADGPATEVIRARCPAAGWYLCAFVDRLPMDANDFLWAPDSPVNRDAAGQARFLGGALISAEAGEIVAATLRAHPIEVALAILRNTARQVTTTGIGDTLGDDHLATALRPRIAEGFPARELAAYDAALQPRGELRAAVPAFGLLHLAVLLLSLPLLALAGLRAARAGDALRLWLLAALLVGVVGNAAATGGLSGVHARYQARIAWLLPVGALLLLLPAAPRRDTP